MKVRTQSRRGLSLLEVFFALAIVAVLAAVLLPTVTANRNDRGPRISCTSNLKQVGLAFRLWSNDHNDQYPFSVSVVSNGTIELTNSPQVFRHFQALSNELVTPKVLVCPVDSKKQRATDFLQNSSGTSFNNNSQLSYFVGFEANENAPQTILSGDRNITGGNLYNGFLRVLTPGKDAGWTSEIHNNAGNIGLGDGSVQQMSSVSLTKQLAIQTNVAIRLAIP